MSPLNPNYYKFLIFKNFKPKITLAKKIPLSRIIPMKIKPYNYKLKIHSSKLIYTTTIYQKTNYLLILYSTSIKNNAQQPLPNLKTY